MKKCIILTLLLTFSLKLFSQPDSSLSQFKVSLELPSIGKAQKLASFILPVALASYGLAALDYKALKRVDLNVRADLMEDYPGFKNHLDDKLQYMPAVSVYALGFAGIKGKNNFVDKTALFFVSNTIMSVSVDFIKTQTHKLRPDGSDNRAFPSGHTSTAFAAAEFMAQEYKDVSPWYAVAGYAMATATGGLRMLNNKHWLSDVVTGAGVGILSTKLAYFAYPFAKKMILKKNASRLTIMPGYQSRYFMCHVAASLN